MSGTGYLAGALFAAATLISASAHAAVCQTEKLTCGTTMPIDGYCECTSHGVTEDGTVVSKAVTHPRHTNSTAGGCGAQPNAPGCR